MLTDSKIDPVQLLERLNADGHVVIENLVDKATVADLRDRVERILAHEREHPADPATATSPSIKSPTSTSSTGGAATTRSSG
jgi:hypothetical protein